MKRENGRGGRPNRKPRHRPPFFAILLLSGFLLLALSFVTFRQIRAGEANRLRLLAGFAEQVEATVPELVTRFVNVVEQSKESCTVSDRLQAVPNVVLVGGPLAPTQEEVQLQVKPDGEQIYLEYHTNLSAADRARCEARADPNPNQAALQRAAGGDEPAAESTTLADDGDELVRFVGRLDLGPAIDPIVIPDVFDLIVLARQEGHDVLFQRGEPELKMGLVSSTWEVPGEGFLSGVTDLVTESDDDEGPSGSGTRLVEVEIADAEYRAFLQPVTLHLRDPSGNQLGTQRWVACGVISWERLLASSFSTSPVMLFLMVALFPILLATWPFLKLWLISPKQRFTRFDVAALLFSCVLALALVAFLLLDAAFMTRIQRTVDSQLRGIAGELAGALVHEIDDVARQLATAREEMVPARDLAPFRVGRPSEDEPTTWTEIGDSLPPGWRTHEGEGSRLRYPLLHSIFWADEVGDQVYKVPFHPDSRLRNRIGDRGYFRCALSLGDLDLRHTAGPRPCPGGQGPRDRGCTVCIESIRSKTTAEDVVAFAVPLETGAGRRPSRADTPESGDPLDPRALVMVTRLASLSQALLPSGVSFAVVDAEGQVQFHSDRRRNASEDFSRAAGGDLLLASMIADRRTGPLSINYWGERYRAFVRPIQDTPWSIVTLRNAGELRARNFELLFDFLNLFLPYLLAVCLLLFSMLRWGQVQVVRYLWPARAYAPIYRAVFGAAPWIVGLFALAWASGVPWAILGASVAAPIAAVAIVYLQASRVRDTWKLAGRDQEFVVGVRRFWLSLPEVVSQESWGPLLSALPPVLATLYVVGAVPPSRRPMAAVLLFLTVGTTYLLPVLRRSFADKASTAPYVAAFTTVLVAVSVLPTIGLFRLAESRQTQLLVQETQIDLARAEARHATRRITEKPPLADRLIGYDTYVEEHVTPWRAATAKVAFGSVLTSGPGPTWGSRPVRWPFAVPTFTVHGTGGTAPGAPDRSPPPAPSNRRLARYVAARPVPLTDLTPDAAGTDLSRYGHGESRWWRAPLGADHRLRLLAALPSPRDPGHELLVVSDDPGGDILEPVDAPRGFGIGFGWVLLVSGAGLFAYFIARRVLLVDLAPNHHLAKLEKILEFMKPDPAHPKRLLLIYPLPEAVVEMAHHGEHRPSWFHTFQFASRWAAGHDDGWRERDFLQPLEREEREAEPTTRERRTIVISDFRPNLEDPEVAKRQIALLETLRRHGTGSGRSMLIITSRPYHRLARAADAPEEGEDDGAREARSWWSGYLARFSQRYGRDAGSDKEFCGLMARLRRNVRSGWWREPDVSEWFEASSEAAGGDAAPAGGVEPRPDDAARGSGAVWKLSSTEKRRLCKLVEVIENECRWTWRLQRIGIEILREIQTDLCEQRRVHRAGNGSLYLPTVAQLVSRIDFAATPYYQRMWDTCEWDEKLALHQLAQEGVVNPKSFDIALDLLNKGLIVREVDKPALRLMNQSFREFVLRTVRRSHLLLWEQEEGFSAWEVWKWVLPLPLLLLGVFLFITQQDAVSNIVGLLIALASLVPTGFNLYQHFQQVMTESEAGSG